MATIFVPGNFYYDIRPVMEDYEQDVVQGAETDPDIIEVVSQFWDESRRVKRGRGFAHRFDLTTPGQLKFLRKEAAYRQGYQTGGKRNAYGNEEQNSGKGSAATRVIARCDAALTEVTA